jgi:hypothetical protein
MDGQNFLEVSVIEVRAGKCCKMERGCGHAVSAKIPTTKKYRTLSIPHLAETNNVNTQCVL